MKSRMRTRFYPFEPKPFHTAFRSNFNFFASDKKRELDTLWQKFFMALADMGKSKRVTTHAMVLMSNHFHLLWSPFLDFPAAEAFDEISQQFAPEIDQRLTWTEHVLPVESYFHYQQVYKYIYRNPVEAGLAARVEGYPYSTIQNVLGRAPLLVGLQDPFGIIFDQFRLLNWLNSPLSRSNISYINQKSLYKNG